ncbi:MAG: tetratricopeptide repeat protein [Planctomycetota bacterium]|nr:MAG: tetratricopeptide repeat protein [Planctomycetota bacterium]
MSGCGNCPEKVFRPAGTKEPSAWWLYAVARGAFVAMVIWTLLGRLGGAADADEATTNALVGRRVVVVEAAPVGVDDRIVRQAQVGDVLLVGAVRPGWVYSATDRGWIRARAVRLPQDAVALLRARVDGGAEGLLYVALGAALAETGDHEAALEVFRIAERAGVSEPVLWLRRGVSRLKLRRFGAAVGDFSKVIENGTEQLAAEALNDRSVAFAGLGRFRDALRDAEKAVSLQPENPVFLNTRGVAHRGLGQLDAAAADFDRALEIYPRYAKALANRGTIAARRGRWAAAAGFLEAAWQIDPRDPFILNELAWLLATCPSDVVRSGDRAVELAEAACELTGRRNGNYLDTLAAALAEAGRFAAAVRTAREAMGKAGPAVRAEIRERLKLYEAKKPFRQPTVVRSTR